MRIALQSPARKIVLVTGVLLAATAYTVFGSAEFLADHWGQNPDPVRLQRAIWLQPGNAEYYYRLGRYFVLVQQSPDSAIQAFKSAVALNPHSARYWLEMASAYQLTGQNEDEKAALTEALLSAPTTPEVAWEAGSLYLVLGENDLALQQFKMVLAHDANFPPLALQFCWRVKPDVDLLLQDVLPAKSDVYSAFLDLLVSKNETAAAAKVWSRLVQLGGSIQTHHVFAYVRYLVGQKDPDQARLVWEQAATIADLADYQPTPSNLIVNGDFSLAVLNGGFDWMYQRRADVDLALDPVQFRTGRRSLSITFDSHGLGDAGIRHLVAVQPATSYEFSAYFKADGLEGVGGPQFAVQDLYSEATYFSSDNLTNVSSWTPVSGRFVTGPDTKLLVVRIKRQPPNSIKGKLWIDGFRLVQSGPKG